MSIYLLTSLRCNLRRTRTARISLWRRSDAIMRRLSAEVDAFESPTTVEGVLDSLFGRPLLGDPLEPDTGRFYSAYTAARAQWRDRAPRDVAAVRRFAAAALDAELRWEQANENARAKARRHVVAGDRQLTRAEQRALRTARELLVLALDPFSTPAEVGAADRKARTILAGLLTIPARLDRRLAELIAAAHPNASTAPTEDGP